jgi:predicted nucleic acid-binding Zn ribbon protein
MAPSTKSCVVCSTPFAAPPSSKKITCSRACSAVRKRETHEGRPHTWGPEARERLREKGKTPNLELGTPAARLSPISGPYETNREAKVWWVVHLPTGRRYRARNLRKWCRDHPELFAPDRWENAYAGLLQVQAWLIGRRADTVSRWKDWTLECEGVRPAPEIGEASDR